MQDDEAINCPISHIHTTIGWIRTGAHQLEGTLP